MTWAKNYKSRQKMESACKLDGALTLFSNNLRRQLLESISKNTTEKTEVVALEDIEWKPEYTESVLLELHHTHLPKLSAVGYIEWEEEAGEVRRGPNFDEIEPLAVLVDEHRDKLPGSPP
ncbi:DUF7344 domain-containing protein [Natronococcus amylolyticus]|uniref:DUF7344 domain-containing protein n=1 Tax=Natronococcus amylolyticus TaxID=44470 RepID=UPI001268C949|nr:transcriptional regulator [Natronococcus amylolyticus]